MLITSSFGTANTGADVYYRVLNADKTVYQSRRNTGVTELVAGSGVYGVEVDDAIVSGRTVVWDIDGTTKSSSETFFLPTVDVDAIDWADLWDSMPTGTNVNVISPVAINGNITIVRGDDYATPEERELTWTDTNNVWPDLTDATFSMSIYHKGIIELTTTAVSHSAGVITAQLLSSETSELSFGTSFFDIQATLSSGRIATLVMGKATVVRDYTT